MGLAVLLLCGAMAGLTFAMVNLTKDLTVRGNMLTSRATSSPVVTGWARARRWRLPRERLACFL